MPTHSPLLAVIFLAASGVVMAAPAVETLPSGVKVEHIKVGEGESPKATSTNNSIGRY